MRPVIWPELSYDPEPTREPRHLDIDLAWADYQAVRQPWCPRERNEVVDATLRALDAIDHAWRTGDIGDLPQLAATLGVDAPRDASHRHYPNAAIPADAHLLARLGADFDPALGNHAPDRLLGPWTALLQLPRDEHLLQIAMAAGAFMVTEEEPLSPRRKWSRCKPQPRQELRDRVRAIAHAPYTVYPVHSLEQGMATLGAGVGEPPPSAPVDVSEVASLPGAPPLQVGDTLAARIVKTPVGPMVSLGIAIPGPIPPAADAWLDLMLFELRLVDRRAGPLDVLRKRGHVLVRRVAEAAWLR